MAFYSSYDDKYDLAKRIVQEEAQLHIEELCHTISEQEVFNQLVVFEKTTYRFFTRVQKYPQLYKCIFQNLFIEDTITYFAHYASLLVKEHFVFSKQENKKLLFNPNRQGLN